MKRFSHVIRALPAHDMNCLRVSSVACVGGMLAGAMLAVAAQAQGNSIAPAQPELKSLFAELKAETAALVAAAQARLDALSPQQRLPRRPSSGECRAPSPSSKIAAAVRGWW